MSQQGDLEERVAAIERTLERMIARAREHPLGRQVLRILGLE